MYIFDAVICVCNFTLCPQLPSFEIYPMGNRFIAFSKRQFGKIKSKAKQTVIEGHDPL